ncbi:uncharacterized protein LOC143898816 [Temnothorax americanus]|uniref:uncharacterized protein LOC143898816 n=1 Tax=Temnothorax americanus TaxID=1964332 RepID=UPI0040679639
MARVGVDHNFVLKISEICKNLKVLDLPGYQEPEDNHFEILENLKSEIRNLKYLKLDYTIYMGVQSFCKMLRNEKWMRKLEFKSLMIELEHITFFLSTPGRIYICTFLLSR